MIAYPCERAIANHTGIVLEREGLARRTEDPKVEALRTWSEGVRSQPWPRIGPYAAPAPEQAAYAAAIERAWRERPETPLKAPR